MKRAFCWCVALVLLALVPSVAAAQSSVTFHFHKETLPGPLLKLLAAGPDAAATFSSSGNLKNYPSPYYAAIPLSTQYLTTAPGTRVLAANTNLTFALWLDKTANWGTFQPRLTVYLGDSYGSPSTGGVSVCQVIGAAITTTKIKQTLDCNIATQLVIGPNQVFKVALDAYVAGAPGSHNVEVRLHYEGTLDGNYDSTMVVPAGSAWSGPLIESLSPTGGYPETLVTVTGSGFGVSQGTSTLQFNGNVLTPTSWSATSIQFVVPTSTLGGKPVKVTVGGLTSNTNYFGYLTPIPPSITSLSPSTANVGQVVTVNGSNFGATQGSSLLKLSGTTITPNTWSSTSIQFTVPGWAFTGPINVRVLGTDSNSQTLTVIRPIMTNLTPDTGTVGTVATVVGTNFGATQGSSLLTYDDVPITPNSWSATAIQFTVPSWATTAFVSVIVNGASGGQATFTVTPVISSLSPSSGQVATAVTINGTGFGTAKGTSVVKYNGITVPTTSWSATAIGFVVPIQPTAAVNVTVKNVVSNNSTFTITAPTLSNINPTSGGLGTYVTITGTGFGNVQSSSEVRFNGSWANPVSWSPTSITVPVSSNATTGPLTVKVAGATSNGITFTVGTTGSISGVVRRASDNAVVSGVLVKALQAAVVKATDTSAGDGTYTLSGLTAGQYDVIAYPTGYMTATYPGTVVAASATATVNIVLTKPAITAVTPPAGPVNTSVTITGNRFGVTQGTSTVTFNGVAASPTSWSDTTIQTTVPAGATTGPLLVTVDGAASNAITFGVGTGMMSGTVTDGAATPIVGALVEILRNNSIIASGTTIIGGTYSIGTLLPDIYDVRFSASGAGTVVTTGLVVTVSGTTIANAALPTPGGIGGKVTKADGTTPIPGASVTIAFGPTSVATVFANGTGDYLANALAPATYSVQAGAAGYIAQTQTGVTVSASTTTTRNFSLLGQSAISYAYDTIGRLIGVTDSLGDTATYAYDAVGNLTGINRYSSATISIVGFAPTHGAAGAQVTIYGTAFSPTPSANTVTFNGTPATVTAASTTQLVVTVPVGASTGTIGVTAPSGSTTSGSVFSIP